MRDEPRTTSKTLMNDLPMSNTKGSDKTRVLHENRQSGCRDVAFIWSKKAQVYYPKNIVPMVKRGDQGKYNAVGRLWNWKSCWGGKNHEKN